MALSDHWTDDPSKNRSKEVPARHVERLTRQFPEPRSPLGPRPEAWKKMLHDIALGIWAEAYAAGVAYGLSISATPQVIYVTDEVHQVISAATREKAAEVIAEIERKVRDQ